MYHRFVRSPELVGLVLAALLVGFGIGFLTERQLVARGIGGSLVSGAPEGVDFSPVWKAWRVIDEKFVPAAVSSTTPVATTTKDKNDKRVWGMIGGLASSLNDPYTFFLPPQENEQFAQDMSGAFEGVGMEIAVKSEVLTVVSPLKNTPAERAGLKSGDQILKIDSKDTKGLDVTQAVKMIRGPKGTQVTLLVQREGWAAPKEIEVTRDVINVPIVETKVKGDVFVISVATFTSNAPELFRSALREFVESGKTKLVLDLRGNPGGYLEAAVDMASWFTPAGKVIVSEDYDGHAPTIVHRSFGYNVFNQNLKMAILVNKGSASASEILADALRYYGVGKLIGTNTFGKGSVQELVEISPGTSLKLTVARWLGPDGVQIPLEGIKPDIEADITEEDVKAGKDPQMDAAIKYLSE
ncbi:MAG: carboxy-terminal-processing protease, carboxyl-terminal processing protease [Candidatus Parcubacteria bacterium]|jgi:carboxyl-terminal processing protease